MSGRATLTSFTINHLPDPIFQLSGPQIIAIVTLAEGPRMMTNLVDVEPHQEAIQLGMSLEVDFDPRGDQWLPVFRPASL